jgi:hypothetical protein
MATKSEITTLENTVEQSAAPAPVAASGLPGASGKRSILTIYSGQGEEGMQDVDCGINGYGFQIKRDMPVNVPIELVEVFKNAVTTTYNAQGVPTNRPRFAYSATPV